MKLGWNVSPALEPLTVFDLCHSCYIRLSACTCYKVSVQSKNTQQLVV